MAGAASKKTLRFGKLEERASAIDFEQKVIVAPNGRRTKRVEIRAGEGVSMRFRFDNGDTLVEGQVMDVSSWGAGVVFKGAGLAAARLAFTGNKNVTAFVQLRPGDEAYPQWCEITQARDDENGRKLFVGLRFLNEGAGQFDHGQSTVVLERSFPLSGFIYKELYFKEKALVRVEALQAKTWTLTAFDSEMLLVKGMPIRFYLFVPHKNEMFIEGTVSRIVKSSYDSISFQVEIEKIAKNVAVHLCNYLVKMCNLSPADLKKVGLEVSNITDNFKFRYAKTDEEYDQVLRLRFDAYTKAGKVRPGSTHKDMASPLDAMSRIITAYHDDLLVASITLTFPTHDDLVMDTEKNLPSGYPKSFPPKTELIEIARFCVRDEYRKSHLVVRMFQHVYRICSLSDRKLLVTSTDDRLWPVYKGIGMKKTGLAYDHPVFRGLIHHLITVPVDCASSAKGIGPLRWNYLYREMTDYLESKGRMRATGFNRVRLWLYKRIGDLLAPLWKEK